MARLCIHCHAEFFTRVPGEYYADRDQCRCGKNDDGTPTDYREDPDDDEPEAA